MTALSNRQRKQLRRRLPKAARKVAPAAGNGRVVEPKGMAVRAALAGQVSATEAARVGGPVRVQLTPERGLEGYIRVPSRDGLVSMHRSGLLDDVQAKGGLAFRMCYEASAKGLASGLGNAGEGGGGRKVAGLVRSAAELHRAYLLARLNQMELAVASAMVDGRELHVLRMVAGEGKTVFELAGKSGHARDAYKAALVRALDAVVQALRITGS